MKNATLFAIIGTIMMLVAQIVFLYNYIYFYCSKGRLIEEIRDGELFDRWNAIWNLIGPGMLISGIALLMVFFIVLYKRQK